MGWAPVLYFKATHAKIKEDSITLNNLEGVQLVLTAMEKANDEKDFDTWVINYGSLCDKTGELINYKEDIIDPFFMHLREFHKNE